MLSQLVAFGIIPTASGSIVPPSIVFAPPSSRIANVGYDAVPILPTKDPDDKLDYGLNFKPLFDDPEDSITSVSIVVEVGAISIPKYGVLAAEQLAVFWVNGGVDGQNSKIRVRCGSAKGRQVDQSVTFKIAQR